MHATQRPGFPLRHRPNGGERPGKNKGAENSREESRLDEWIESLFFHSIRPVKINNLYIASIAALPYETYRTLIINEKNFFLISVI
jgi:hypothetical protein